MSTFDELMSRYERCIYTRKEFVSSVAALMTVQSIDEMLTRMPPDIREDVVAYIKSLATGRAVSVGSAPAPGVTDDVIEIVKNL